MIVRTCFFCGFPFGELTASPKERVFLGNIKVAMDGQYHRLDIYRPTVPNGNLNGVPDLLILLLHTVCCYSSSQVLSLMAISVLDQHNN